MRTPPVRLGVMMDPIARISPHKDSTLAMLLEAQRRGWEIRYMEQQDLWMRDGEVFAAHRGLRVADDPEDWFELGEAEETAAGALDVIFMRKDPPFDMEYIYTTYLLERAEQQGVLVVNRPSALRDVSEKVYTAWFPELCPPTLVARDPARLRGFVRDVDRAVLKPLDGMGGASVFVTHADDPNLTVILENLTEHGRRHAMAQTYLPRISEGDMRVLLVDGEPVPYMLARIPLAGETRGNLAAGGRGEGIPLGEEERRVAEEVGPVMRAKGLVFVGLDLIGGRLTEINVTSPTCIRELDRAFGINIAGTLLDAVERYLRP